jgi:hypothetical protein
MVQRANEQLANLRYKVFMHNLLKRGISYEAFCLRNRNLEAGLLSSQSASRAG